MPSLRGHVDTIVGMQLVRRYWAPALGVVAILVGAFLAVTAPVGIGWAAYAPLSALSFAPVSVPPQFVAGVALAIAGLALLAGWFGYRLGARRSRAGRAD